MTVRDLDDVETTLTNVTHYTVSDVGETAGGTVALVAGVFDWLDGLNFLKFGYKLTIRRIVPLTQETDIRNAGTFYPSTLEDQFDKQAMISQQHQGEIDRAVKLPWTVTTSEFDPTFPADILESADKVPLMNANGDGFADAEDWPTANDIAQAQVNATAAAASAVAAASSASASSVSAAASASSAASAAAALASAFFRDVVYLTSASSPYTVSQSDNGKLFDIDSSGGAITINLPTIAGLTLPFNVAMKLTIAGNNVTINRDGTDTIDGGTTKTLIAAGTGIQISADTDGSPDNWTSLDFGTIADGAITTPKLADSAVTLAKLAAAVAEALNPAGAVIAFGGTSAPAGYLACDGSQVSRTTYAALFAAIGTAHGSGDGSTTFHLPSYSGRFLRGWANGSANDPDRASRTAMASGGATGDNVGSVQGHAFQTHNHGVTDPGHTHVVYGVLDGGANQATPRSLDTTNNGNRTTSSSSTGVTVNNASASGATSQSTSNETRPTNANVLFCIKT